jgi:hypothetical protein
MAVLRCRFHYRYIVPTIDKIPYQLLLVERYPSGVFFGSNVTKPRLASV